MGRAALTWFFFLTLLGGAGVVRAQDASPPQSPADASEEDMLRYVLTGQWIDPAGEFWRPRRGARTELSLFVGGEGSLDELGTLDHIPSMGGTSVMFGGRYYPVDRLAIGAGVKGYLGIAQPAVGTAAETVLAPYFGVRWDLVREGRFSMLVDVTSGPAIFLFTDIIGAIDGLGAAWALGGESSLGLAFRYSLGPWTGELRTFAGGRVGSANDIGRPSFAEGPFSALFVGVDSGVTWSFGGGDEPRPARTHARR